MSAQNHQVRETYPPASHKAERIEDRTNSFSRPVIVDGSVKRSHQKPSDFVESPDQQEGIQRADSAIDLASQGSEVSESIDIMTNFGTQNSTSNDRPQTSTRYVFPRDLQQALVAACSQGSIAQFVGCMTWAQSYGWLPTVLTFRETLVYTACLHGQIVILNHLKAQKLIRHEDAVLAIVPSIIGHHPPVLSWFVDIGLPVNRHFESHIGPLMWAIKLDCPQVVERLLNQGCTEHRQIHPPHHHKHLAVAASMPHALPICRLLLRYPPGDNRNVSIRETGALQIAAARGDGDLVLLFLEHLGGQKVADLPRVWNMTNNKGGEFEMRSALQEAVIYGHESVVLALLEAGASIRYGDLENMSAWDHAVTRMRVDGGRMLQVLQAFDNRFRAKYLGMNSDATSFGRSLSNKQERRQVPKI